MSTATFNQTRFEELTAKIEYSAKFVPLSRSRNKEGKYLSLNWIVSLKSGRAEFSTDYSQGVGFIPKYQHNNRLVIYQDAVKETCETGNDYTAYYKQGSLFTRAKGRPLSPPAKADVFSCLLSESDVLDFSCFDDWASEFGYDTDSRKAEKVYNSCLKTALKFRQFFNESELSDLRVLFQDY